MLQCAPYIKNVCEKLNNKIWTEQVEEEESPHQSSIRKKESEVRLTDVKQFEVNIFQPQENKGSISLEGIPKYKYKSIRKIRPDSPDVIRAAKRFEQSRLKDKWKNAHLLETTEEGSQGSDDGGKQLGAICTVNR